jgi:L-threonylcarbamoyladenylate synthase
VLEGGVARVGIESTVLSLVGQATLLRPGVIPLPDIEALIGTVRVETAPEGPHSSPGMHERHYRPRTPLYLMRPGDPLPTGRGAQLRIGLEMPSAALDYAAALYGALHRLDHEGYDWIAVERPPETAEWAGVLDRLKRAAE